VTLEESQAGIHDDEVSLWELLENLLPFLNIPVKPNTSFSFRILCTIRAIR
jgi:hypothetical protein